MHAGNGEPVTRFHVGSDHGGVTLRRVLVNLLQAEGHEVASIEGPASATESVDYPDIAVAVCRRVVDDPGAIGLLLCGSGQGMAMTANRVPGVRAALLADVASARLAREHNDANVICLGERVLGVEVAKELVHAFLRARFQGGRHQRRIDKIMAAGEG